jgi:non-heme chloroperoxidase
MKKKILWIVCLAVLSGSTLMAQDTSPHSVQFITVDNNVKLEVLDWGGSGRPLVLLSGLGNTAHVFDGFAPKLTSRCRVYGVTRRGFGASSAPAPANSNYSADRLGDDVLAVMDALKLDRPILVGHSIAGEELSSIATRHPEEVAGLIYLEAGYSYAYYDRSHGDFLIDLHELERKLGQLRQDTDAQDMNLIQELLQQTVPRFERDLKVVQHDLQLQQPSEPPPPEAADLVSFAAYRLWQTRTFGFSFPEGELRQGREIKSDGTLGKRRDFQNASQAIATDQRKYADIRVPVLAFFAVPHVARPSAYKNTAVRAAAEANDRAYVEMQARAFENGVPSARVVRLPHANHYIFLTNEADVLREMNAFLERLQ